MYEGYLIFITILFLSFKYIYLNAGVSLSLITQLQDHIVKEINAITRWTWPIAEASTPIRSNAFRLLDSSPSLFQTLAKVSTLMSFESLSSIRLYCPRSYRPKSPLCWSPLAVSQIGSSALPLATSSSSSPPPRTCFYLV